MSDNTVHHRKIFAHLGEMDIRGILTKAIAEREGFEIDLRHTRISMVVDKKDHGSSGFKPYIEITMVNDLQETEDENN